jgi:stearoyl-CoA desaturase (delta-9 desaturase)
VLAQYGKKVISPVVREESLRIENNQSRSVLRRIKTVLMREPSLVDPTSQQQLKNACERYPSLNVVYQFRLKLQNLWMKSTASQAELLEALQEWCRQAEATGIKALREFVKHLKAYVPKKKDLNCGNP